MKNFLLVCVLLSAVAISGCSLIGDKKSSQTGLEKCLAQNGTYITDENGEGTCSLP